MKKAALGVGVFLCALIFLSSDHVSAVSQNKPRSMPTLSALSAFEYNALAAKPEVEKIKEPKSDTEPVKKEPTRHTVAGGESLTMIADKYGSTWTRLFAKNTQIVNPNIINVGETITIPEPDEQLAERSAPAPPPQIVQTTVAPTGQSGPAARYSGSSAGNTYYPGYCTWYAKDRRPDLPNSLGNADTWVARAQTLGIPTGSNPRPGAIGQQGMHVVYVESVNGDGTVTISEMNYQGFGIVSTRTVPAGNFMYIY